MNNLFYLQKSNQPCILFPWVAEAPCPWGPGYARVLIPLPRGRTNKDGTIANVQVVNTHNLRRQKDNRQIPQGGWFHLT